MMIANLPHDSNPKKQSAVPRWNVDQLAIKRGQVIVRINASIVRCCGDSDVAAHNTRTDQTAIIIYMSIDRLELPRYDKIMFDECGASTHAVALAGDRWIKAGILGHGLDLKIKYT
jgi:hypothetical protein